MTKIIILNIGGFIINLPAALQVINMNTKNFTFSKSSTQKLTDQAIVHIPKDYFHYKSQTPLPFNGAQQYLMRL